MTEMMVKIIIEVLDILGTATKEMKQSRFSEDTPHLRFLKAHLYSEKFIKKVAGIRKLDDALQKLDKLTNEEARMANAEALRIGHIIEKKVEGVDKKVQGVGTQVKDVEEKVQGVDKDVRCIGENVIVVKEKVQTAIDGTQTVLN